MLIRIDDLGRVQIPKTLRRTLEFESGSFLEAEVHEGKQELVLHKIRDHCAFCGATGNLLSFKNHYICPSCAQALRGKLLR